MKLALAFAAAAAIAAATPALAGDAPAISWYGNLGYTANSFSDGTLNSVTGRLGGRSAHIGLEAEASAGLGDTTISGFKVGVKDQYAGYLVGFLPIENGDFFARVGYGTFATRAPYGLGASVSTTNVGVGGQWFLKGGHNGVRVEYTYMKPSSSDGHFNAYGLSYVRKF
jgi:hypothetical protein